MKQSVLVYCWRGCNPVKNFGEWYCRLVLNHLEYKDRYYARQRSRPHEPVLLVIGSNFHTKMLKRLLADAEEVWVWGQGNGWGPEWAADPEDYGGRVRVFAVRGPLTRDQAHLPEDTVCCDPGVLVPRIVERGPPSGEVLYVPHHTDQKEAEDRAKALGCADWIDVYMRWKWFIPTVKRLASAGFVLTSSLHTAITCTAYGTPWAFHLSAAHDEIGEPWRWRDLAASLGLPGPPPSVTDAAEGRLWHQNVRDSLRLPDTDALLVAFPHDLVQGVTG